jgi:hypothetical protein
MGRHRNVNHNGHPITTDDRQKMRNITIALPRIYVEKIEELRKEGVVPSRSEAIRVATKQLIQDDFDFCELIAFIIQGEN